MKLIIFGSTGGIGRQVVAQALEQGHDVSAVTRSPEKFDQSYERLKVIGGDVLDPAFVKNVILGSDGVVCALGMPPSSKEQLRANGTKNIIRAMEDTGVKRLVCLSALGVGDSRNILPFSYKYIIIPLIMGRLFADHELQEYYVKNSALDWVIVRPGNFSKGEHTGIYRHGFAADDKRPALKISHGDVAEFMLKQFGDDTYLRKTPCVSY